MTARDRPYYTADQPAKPVSPRTTARDRPYYTTDQPTRPVSAFPLQPGRRKRPYGYAFPSSRGLGLLCF